ncbi:gliding motility-associated C-terminal domain-containing protein [Myroides odoratimimus]|uniref:gliding motility-associated C-terminal domain-containing protein n=1 Tax=Myroides odoratimimus TaxID=76832 RepID=UPI003100D2F4
MRKIHLYIICFSLWNFAVFGQESVEEKFINQGELIVLEGGILSIGYNFENSISGNFENKGEVYYYDHFKNDNLFYPGTLSKKAKVYFHPKKELIRQEILGQSVSEFHNVEFRTDNSNQSFLLGNEISVKGESNFISGIIKVSEQEGMFTFLSNSKSIGASDKSHVEGYVEKQGKDSFIYPIGDSGYYRPAKLSASSSEKDLYMSRYVYSEEDFFLDKSSKSGVIEDLNTKEYWEIKRSDSSSGNVLLTLSWDDRTTPSELLTNPEKELHIVRWDAKQQLWVDEGGVVDLSNKEITTISGLTGYGYFTLARVKTDLLLEGDLVIYNLISPDGDGKNDYFIIDNINRYPNNTVEIYNRWGVKVYETSNYNSSDNVFRGYSDGRVTVEKSDKLPSGTYFYIVTYEYKDTQGSRMIKKSGYLHLEMD